MELGENSKYLSFFISFRGTKKEVSLPRSSTLQDLGVRLTDMFKVALHTQKLIPPRQKPGTEHKPLPAAFFLSHEEHREVRLEDAGFAEGMVFMLVASTQEELQAIEQASPRGDSRTLGFADEAARALRRRRQVAEDSASRLPKGPYTFGGFRTLSLPGIQLTPPPSEALRLMHRLASDLGIVAIMEKYRWRVGIMSEMAPEGYVGISPKCILGLNVNKGQEISLRLRTDDLRGFRKYDSIRKTLLHELAHMVHSEHDDNFHALDVLLNKEVIALDWTKGQGHTLAPGGSPRAGDWYDDLDANMDDRMEDDMDAMAATGRSSGQRLGGGSMPDLGAREVAVAAALQRTQASAKPTSEAVQARAAPELGQATLGSGTGAMEVDGGDVADVVMAGGRPGDGQVDLVRIPDADVGEPDGGGLVTGEKGRDVVSSGEVVQVGSGLTGLPADKISPLPGPAGINATLSPGGGIMEVGLPGGLDVDTADREMTGVVGDADIQGRPVDGSLRRQPRVDPPGEAGWSQLPRVDPPGEAGRPQLDPLSEPGRPRLDPPGEILGAHGGSGDGMMGVPGGSGDATLGAPGGSGDGKLGAPGGSGDGKLGAPGGSRAEGGLEGMDVETARVFDVAAATGVRLQTAVDSIRREAGEGAKPALETLLTIFRNVREHPGEAKYRKVRKSNAAFHRRAGQYAGAMELLNLVGFRDEGGDSVDGESLVLRRDDPGLLWLACATVEAAIV